MPDFIKAPPAVLAFAATDPSGGAGIQADILTLSSMGCHPLSVITAITVQNTSGVEAISALDADLVADQARAILEDIPVAAFKIGVLGSAENVAAVAEIVADYPEIPLILDPVLASARGDEFANEDTLCAIRELLIPQCTVITPNSPELRRLALEDDEDSLEIEKLAMRLIEMGCEYVLVTGTHEGTADVINTVFFEKGIVRSDTWQRLPASYHGSGCTLASALAATIARGLDISEAAREAQEYTWQTLKFGFRPGMGQHLPDRMFWAREDEADERTPGEKAPDRLTSPGGSRPRL
jgi:hydroxymethylpyrimidine/phosphomethylpyrimidine kinase